MSTTPATREHALSAESPLPVSATDYTADGVFDELWDDDEHCNGCFARIRDREEFNPAPYVSDYAPTSRTQRVGAGVAGHHPADLPTDSPSTWCDDCGSEHGRAADTTLTQREAVRRARTLADAVEELGVAINRSKLLAFVRQAKSRETLQGHDTEIFRRATTIAVRAEVSANGSHPE